MTHVFIKYGNSPACLIVPSQDHIELFLRLQNEQETRQWFIRYLPLGRKQEQEWLDKANTTQSDIVFAIGTYPELKAVGSIGLHRIHWKDRRAELGIGVLPDLCGKGNGSGAAMLMLHYAFNELGLNKVTWNAVAYNERSIACCKKCGGEEVGRYKRHILRNNEWHDQVAFDIHQEAWMKKWEEFKNKYAPTSA